MSDLSRVLWAAGLWLALLAGICVAWSPRYWAVSVAITGICTVMAGWMIFSGKKVEWPPQTPLLILIGAWGFLQMAFKTTELPGLTVGNAVVWAVGTAAFITAAQILRSRAALHVFLRFLLWSVTALAVAAMLQYYSMPVRVFGIFPAIQGVTGTFLSSNQFAALMELAAPVALCSMQEKNPLPGALCYAMILAGAITAGSRAGVTLIFSELLVFLGLVLYRRRLEAKTILLIFGGLALMVTTAAAIAGTDRIEAHFRDKPYAIRRQLLDSTLQMIAERPWTGHGMGTWRAIYPHAATFDMALLANEAHNDWAQWTSDGGIPFLLLMAILVLWTARPAVQSVWGLGVLSVMAHSLVDYPIREPVLSFLWFALAGAVSQYTGAGGPESPENKGRSDGDFTRQ